MELAMTDEPASAGAAAAPRTIVMAWWVEGTTFKHRSHGEEKGPYETLEAAEAAAICRPCFSGSEISN